MKTLSKEQAEVRRRLEKALCERSLRDFIKLSWHIIEPGTRYMSNWHIDAIADHLTAVKAGHIRRLIVTMPPRHMKSISISVDFPVWCWLDDPSLRFLTASYALSLSIRDARKSRLILESNWFRDLWPDIQLSDDQNAKSRYENTQHGYRLATSVGGGMGEGADIAIVDDPHNARDLTLKKLKAAQEWFGSGFTTRLNNPKKSAIIVVQQRLNDEDLAGFLLKQGGWILLNLPAEYEGNKAVIDLGALGKWQDPRTVEGDLLWPERVGPEEIAFLKKSLGTAQYTAQFQQRPVPKSGGQFKQDYFHYFTRDGEMLRLDNGKVWKESQCKKFITVDLAIQLREENDFTVFSTWLETPDKELLLVDVVRERMDNPTQVERLTRLYQRERPQWIAVESVAYQLAMVQQLRKRGIPTKEFKPKGDKSARAAVASVLYEGGQVFHLKNASWLPEIEAELLHFPKGSHDDFVDTDAMAAYFLTLAVEPRIRRL